MLFYFSFPFIVPVLQVDLFFYREPEETKQQEEEDVAAPVDYALPGADYGMPGAMDNWPSAVADAGWSSDMIAPPIPAVPASNWAPDQGKNRV